MLGSLLPSEIIANCLCVGAGGFVGAVARYLLGLVIPTHASGFPVGTFVVNVAGAFVIAFAFTLFMRMMGFDNRLLLFLTTGLCGGFTTFSTFTWESLKLIERGDIVVAVVYLAATCVACLIAAFAGQAVAGHVGPGSAAS